MKNFVIAVILFLLCAIQSCKNHQNSYVGNLIIDSCNGKQVTIDWFLKNSFLSQNINNATDTLIKSLYFDNRLRLNEFLQYTQSIIENENATKNLNKEFPETICLLKYREYYAADSIVYIYDSPVINNAKIIDSLKAFTKLSVPLFEDKPIIIANAVDSWITYDRYLCYYNGKFGFFSNYKCIDSSRIENFNGNEYQLFHGDNLILKELKSSKYFEFPSTEINWSNDKSKAVFVSNYEAQNSEGFNVPIIKMFDIHEWSCKFLTTGLSPKFLESDKFFLYFAIDTNNPFTEKSINKYIIDSNENILMLKHQDTLNFGCSDPDMYYRSEIKIDTILGRRLYSVKLFNSDCDDPNVRVYNAYFNENGLIKMEKK